MYQALLTRKYLTSKIMPLLAMAAVTLSVGTVLVTWSVMGGFLSELLNSGRTLLGDVTITWPNTGFPHYDDLIERLESDDAVEAACAQIETFGLLSLPDDKVEGVVIKGVVGPAFDRVTQGRYAESIWWKPIDQPLPRDKDGSDPRYRKEGFWSHADWPAKFDAGLALTEPTGEPAAVLGIELTGFNIRTSEGLYLPGAPLRAARDGREEAVMVFLPDDEITLHVMPLDDRGRAVEVSTRRIPVANEFHSGIYEADSKTMLVRLDLIQSMLRLDQAERVDPNAAAQLAFDPQTGEPVMLDAPALGVDPARVTTVLVRGRDDLPAERLAERCRQIYAEFAEAYPGEVPPAHSILVRTWRDLNRTTIAAVEKETGLVLFIFGLVCFTTVFLVLAIFWSMVSEKTRDVGVLRALGASTSGITWLWLRYGAAVGVVGSSLGLVAAWLVVRNINEIHEWLGDSLGLVIWDPTVYYFVEIPTDLEASKAVLVAAAGVLTCLLGAALPAARAGLMDPVRALRFE